MILAGHHQIQTFLTLKYPKKQKKQSVMDRRTDRHSDGRGAHEKHCHGRPRRRRTMGQNQVILRHQKFTFPRARE